MLETRSVASAPGKVLMTGGYLILERPNAGLVLSTNARFYAIVKPLYDDIKPDSWAWVSEFYRFCFEFVFLVFSLVCSKISRIHLPNFVDYYDFVATW